MYKRLAAIVLAIVLVLSSTVYAADVTIHVYRDGEPVKNAVVELYRNGTLVARRTTNVNGTVYVYNIQGGDYTIYVYVNGSVYRFDKTIDENTTELNLSLSGLEGVKASARTWLNNYLVLGGLVAAFVFGLAIAYGLSGRRVPKRRR